MDKPTFISHGSPSPPEHSNSQDAPNQRTSPSQAQDEQNDRYSRYRPRPSHPPREQSSRHGSHPATNYVPGMTMSAHAPLGRDQYTDQPQTQPMHSPEPRRFFDGGPGNAAYYSEPMQDESPQLDQQPPFPPAGQAGNAVRPGLGIRWGTAEADNACATILDSSSPPCFPVAHPSPPQARHPEYTPAFPAPRDVSLPNPWANSTSGNNTDPWAPMSPPPPHHSSSPLVMPHVSQPDPVTSPRPLYASPQNSLDLPPQGACYHPQQGDYFSPPMPTPSANVNADGLSKPPRASTTMAPGGWNGNGYHPTPRHEGHRQMTDGMYGGQRKKDTNPFRAGAGIDGQQPASYYDAQSRN